MWTIFDSLEPVLHFQVPIPSWGLRQEVNGATREEPLGFELSRGSEG
jgi:hypothetical protein